MRKNATVGIEATSRWTIQSGCFGMLQVAWELWAVANIESFLLRGQVHAYIVLATYR
jgi:hypothetical protein